MSEKDTTSDLNPNKEKDKAEAKKAGKLYVPTLWRPSTPPLPHEIEE